ncbi:acetylcholinesterase-like [Saccoglossus kowalevskii]
MIPQLVSSMQRNSELSVHSHITRYYPHLLHTDFDEDCLTLNIYVPADVADRSLAVMLWIPPGHTSMTYDGNVLSATQTVIVITTNYRLGALGFLSTMDRYALGNYGLLDQQLAIRWVKDNIANFGGDPSKITIFGGGVSVGFHMLSPTNKGLFQRGISESGVPTSSQLAGKPATWARKLGKNLNCSDVSDHGRLLTCLRSSSWQDIVNNNPAQNTLTTLEGQFAPVVDGEFITDTPENMIYKSNFSNYDYLLGFNSHEGAMLYNLFGQTLYPEILNSPGLSSTQFNQLLEDDIQGSYDDELDLVADACIYKYTDWQNTFSEFDRLTNFMNFKEDKLLIAPTIDTARKHERAPGTGRLYLYQFSYRSSVTTSPPWIEGAIHGDEISYVFGVPKLTPSTYSSAEQALSDDMMTYWGNFAKNGNPNFGDATDVTWPEFTNEEELYIDLGIDVTVKDHVRANDVAFWQ